MTKARFSVATAVLALLPTGAPAQEAAAMKIPPAVCAGMIAGPSGPPVRAGLHEVALVLPAPSCAIPQDRPVAAKALPAPRPRPAPWRAGPM